MHMLVHMQRDSFWRSQVRTRTHAHIFPAEACEHVSSIRTRYLVHTSCFFFFFFLSEIRIRLCECTLPMIYRVKLGINLVFTSLSEGILEFQKFRSDAVGIAFCLSCLLFETFWKKDTN